MRSRTQGAGVAPVFRSFAGKVRGMDSFRARFEYTEAWNWKSGIISCWVVYNLGLTEILQGIKQMEKRIGPYAIGHRRRGQQRMRWLDSIDFTDMNLHKLRETAENRGAWWATVHGVAKKQIRLSKWTAATCAIERSEGDARKRLRKRSKWDRRNPGEDGILQSR